MSRPDAPFYVGLTRPGAVGWTRIALTAVLLVVVVAVALASPGAVSPVLVALVVLALIAVLVMQWMRLWTRFVVDDRGLTVSWGGFWPRPSWPLASFRSVQLRELGPEEAGPTVRSYGWRRGTVLPDPGHQRRALPGERVRTLAADDDAPYRLLVTRPGTMVEIIGRDGEHFMISPVDPEATAQAVAQAIRARR